MLIPSRRTANDPSGVVARSPPEQPTLTPCPTLTDNIAVRAHGIALRYHKK